MFILSQSTESFESKHSLTQVLKFTIQLNTKLKICSHLFTNVHFVTIQKLTICSHTNVHFVTIQKLTSLKGDIELALQIMHFFGQKCSFQFKSSQALRGILN